MERKIGEIFEYNGEWYQCVESDGCGECSLFTTECGSGTKSDLADEVFGKCSEARRSDNKHVIFKKLEKVGDPYAYNGIVVQKYKLETNQITIPGNLYTYFNGIENTIEIGIKQNKEDMEENKLNLKPFDIQKAREGKPVCTRDGRKARILCYDFKQNEEYPILVAVENKDGKECALLYSNGGISEMYKSSNNELAMLHEKKEGWVKIRKDVILYNTKEEADRKMIGNDEYVTAKVCWEE